MKRKTDEFLVITDSGKNHMIYEYTNILDAGTLQNPKATVPGLKEFRTSDGMAVNFVNRDGRLCRVCGAGEKNDTRHHVHHRLRQTEHLAVQPRYAL